MKSAGTNGLNGNDFESRSFEKSKLTGRGKGDVPSTESEDIAETESRDNEQCFNTVQGANLLVENWWTMAIL